MAQAVAFADAAWQRAKGYLREGSVRALADGDVAFDSVDDQCV